MADTFAKNMLGALKWGSIYAVAARDSYVYMGNGSLLQILNVSDTSAPKIISEINMGFPWIEAIILKDSFAYVGANQLFAINISDPVSPQKIDSVYLFSEILRLVTVDSFIYATTV